jgi:NitT/TauT family transport system permease protein
MTAAATMTHAGAPPRRGIVARFLASRFVAVTVIVVAIIAVWYIAAFLLNARFQRELDENAGVTPNFIEFVQSTLEQERPVMPSPHQVGEELYTTVMATPPMSKRSLVYHAWVTLSSTLLGFLIGTLLGIVLAVAIVHVRSLDKSLMPWIISSNLVLRTEFHLSNHIKIVNFKVYTSFKSYS